MLSTNLIFPTPVDITFTKIVILLTFSCYRILDLPIKFLSAKLAILFLALCTEPVALYAKNSFFFYYSFSTVFKCVYSCQLCRIFILVLVWFKVGFLPFVHDFRWDSIDIQILSYVTELLLLAVCCGCSSSSFYIKIPNMWL